MSKKKILLVDDEVDITESLSLFFRNRDFDVITENDSQKVADVVKGDQGIDLIIMDIKMPGMKGIDVFKQIREMGLDVPVIFLTGSISLGKYINELKDFGFKEENFLDKPINLKFLLEKVNAVLGE